MKSISVKDFFRIAGIPVLVASLCCLAPVILVLFGLSTAAFAASLSDVLYGQYRWLFRAAGLILLAGSLFFYLRRQKGICTLDEAKKRRNEIVNIATTVLIVGVVGYVIWLYVIVELVGVLLGIWG